MMLFVDRQGCHHIKSIHLNHQHTNQCAKGSGKLKATDDEAKRTSDRLVTRLDYLSCLGLFFIKIIKNLQTARLDTPNLVRSIAEPQSYKHLTVNNGCFQVLLLCVSTHKNTVTQTSLINSN